MLYGVLLFQGCEKPPAVNNSRVDWFENERPSTALYKCDENYIMKGKANVTCIKRTWTPPICGWY